jgi:2-amino-4-hydroxy-6-hydroxymethyldihydropteridine diphosphokinase
MEMVLIGLGSNQGDSAGICLQAVERLSRNPGVRLSKISSFYRTQPVGMVEQNWFVNGVAECETSLEPAQLLEIIHEIEKEFGRVREVRWGPRTLDLDILAYGEQQIALPHLTVPHPRLHKRRFVLVPLVEISPDWIHPTLKISASDLLDRLSSESGQEIERL